MHSGKTARLAIDIGGTFTDVVLETGGQRTVSKVLTTTSEPEVGFLEGVQAVFEKAGVRPGEVDLIVHGTTLATNALIERKGAVGLVCTKGFRDSLEIAYEHRFEQYDLYMERPAPLVPRGLRLEVGERVAADGAVLLPLRRGRCAGRGRASRRGRLEAVAVCFLHSYVNPAHERTHGALLGRCCQAWRSPFRARSAARSASTSAPRPPSPMPMCCR